MPEIDLVGPIAALGGSLLLALLVRTVLALSARADTRRAEQVLRHMKQRGDDAAEREEPRQG